MFSYYLNKDIIKMLEINENETLIRSTDAIMQTIAGAKPHPPIDFTQLQQDIKRRPSDLDALFLLPPNGLAVIEMKKENGKFNTGQDRLFKSIVYAARECKNNAYYLKCVHETKRGLPSNLNEIYILEEIDGYTKKREYFPKEMPLWKWLTEHNATLTPVKLNYIFQAASQGLLLGSYGYTENSSRDAFIERIMHWIVNMFTKARLPSQCFFMEGGTRQNGKVNLSTSSVIRLYNGETQYNDPGLTVYDIQEDFQTTYNTYPKWELDNNAIRKDKYKAS